MQFLFISKTLKLQKIVHENFIKKTGLSKVYVFGFTYFNFINFKKLNKQIFE